MDGVSGIQTLPLMSRENIDLTKLENAATLWRALFRCRCQGRITSRKFWIAHHGSFHRLWGFRGATAVFQIAIIRKLNPETGVLASPSGRSHGASSKSSQAVG
jgi:hypothetical protein